MQIEPFPEKDAYRCWLSHDKQRTLLDKYTEETKKQLALRVLLYGLRSDEVEWMWTRHSSTRIRFESLQAPDRGRQDWVSRDTTTVPTHEQMLMLKNAHRLTHDDPLVDIVT